MSLESHKIINGRHMAVVTVDYHAGVVAHTRIRCRYGYAADQVVITVRFRVWSSSRVEIIIAFTACVRANMQHSLSF